MIVVKDNFVRTPSWPDEAWQGWVRYECGKRASNLTDGLPQDCSLLLGEMAALPVGKWFGEDLIPDLSLWGSGLHEMGSGSHLSRHLDSDTHRRLGLERVLSAILWVHPEWEHCWGGELLIGGITIDPMPGRLVVFDCRSQWHQVAKVCCPEAVSRKSLAMFWYSANPGNSDRPQAQFKD